MATSPSGSVRDYFGRTVDLAAYQGVRAAGDASLEPTLSSPGEGGRAVTGVQKLAQRVVVELLKDRGSQLFWPEEGTDLLFEARSGFFRSVGDLLGGFARAAALVAVRVRAEERESDPPDERLARLSAESVTLESGRATVRVRVETRAGPDRVYVFPLAVPF